VVLSNYLILEIGENSDSVEYRDIEAAIITVFGEVDYFIPIYHEKIGSYTSSSVLMEGYVFVKDTPTVRDCLANLRDQRIFSKVLCRGSHFETVSSTAIAVLKRKLKYSLKRRYSVGDKVKVLDGIFKALEGEVISVDDGGKTIMVKIKRMSREMIAPVPATLLEKVEGVDGSSDH
jgi:transcription antitermination factor NusG